MDAETLPWRMVPTCMGGIAPPLQCGDAAWVLLRLYIEYVQKASRRRLYRVGLKVNVHMYCICRDIIMWPDKCECVAQLTIPNVA